MRVELLGIPRQRAGVAEVDIQAENLGQLLSTLKTRFPALAELVSTGQTGRPRPFVAVNLNGDRFVTDPGTELADTDCILILSADAGG